MMKTVGLALVVVLGLCGLVLASPPSTSNVRTGDATPPAPRFFQCELECPPGALQEGEPNCYDYYVDNYNGGCNSNPFVFSILEPSCGTITLCGTSGTYYTDGDYRDTDWFEISLADSATVTFCCTAEFGLLMGFVDGNSGCPVYDFMMYTFAGPCQQACLQTLLWPGTYWLWVGPDTFWGIPCGSDYVMTVDGYGGDEGPCCVNPTVLNFGSVDIGSYLDMDFTILNTWGEPLSGDVTEYCDAYEIVSGGGAYDLAPGESLTVTVRFAPTTLGEQDCQVATGIDCPAVECTGIGAPRYCSFPCWNWAAGCLRGPNRDVSTLPACIRDDHFDDAFTTGLTVGVSGAGRHKATWTSAEAVEAFACGYGLPAALGRDYVDPASNQLGSIYGEVMALRLNREFSCGGYFTDRSKCYGTAVVPPEVLKFAGLTVDQLLAVADQALGGNPSALLPYGNSLFRLESAVAYMNQLYDDCGRLVVPAPFRRQVGDGDPPDETARPLPASIAVTSRPNPLETSVTISLGLPAAANVSLEIYDVRGRRLVTMASRPMEEGYHDVTWNGADDSGAPVASGVYFLKVQVDGQTAAMHKLTKL